MYSPLSDEFQLQIRANGATRRRADLYSSPTDIAPVLSDLELSGFSVRVDRRSDIRRTGSCTVVDALLLAEMIRRDSISPIEPYGSEIRLYHGVEHANSTEELVPIGVFQIETISWSHDMTAIEFVLNDRSRAIQRNSSGLPLDGSGRSASAFIEELVAETFPDLIVQFHDDLVDLSLPGGTTYREDHLAVIRKVAEAMGGEFYFDVTGQPRVDPIPYVDQFTGNDQAVWEIDAGQSGVLKGFDSSISRKDTYNLVHVMGAAANDVIPYAFARDGDPRSPTYYYGRFGPSATTIEKQELTTADQCQIVANAHLQNVRGLARSISLEALAHPGLEAGDPILVVFLDGSEELHLLDAFNLDQSGGMSAETRVQVIV